MYASLPFGWKASAYIYHSTGLVATSYIRTLRVPCSQYIDDRHNGQLATPTTCNWCDFQKAEAAAYIVTSILITLGYTLALSKSQLLPLQCVRFLGYLSNSLLKAFLLPEDKKEKLKSLREDILSRNEVDVTTFTCGKNYLLFYRRSGSTVAYTNGMPCNWVFCKATPEKYYGRWRLTPGDRLLEIP